MKSIKSTVKSTVKDAVSANKLVSNLFYSLFKEKISINVQDKSISYYMNPLFGRSLPGIDINGEYEGPFLSRLINDMIEYQAKAEICYFDIGGSFGFDILVLDSFLQENVTYFTFEPDKFSRIYLKKNVSGIPVQIIEKFVSDKSDGDYITIDDFCVAENVAPTHIKIDIEGGEIYALKGMIDTLKKHKPRLYIEFHEIFIRNRFKLEQSAIQEFFDTLSGLGYEMEFNSHHYPLFSGTSKVYDYNWVAQKPNDQLYAVVCQ